MMDKKPIRQINAKPMPAVVQPQSQPLMQRPIGQPPHKSNSPLILKINSLEEINLLLSGLDTIKDNKAVILPDLKRRLNAVALEFKKMPAWTENVLKTAAMQRNTQRRRDGRG